MSIPITWSTLLQNIKSRLIEQNFDDTQIKFALNKAKIPPFQKTQCIVIIPEGIIETEVGNLSYQEVFNLSIIVLQKNIKIDDDAEFIGFFDFIKSVKDSLRDMTFDNMIIDASIDETGGFDDIAGDQQCFIHSAEIAYHCIIKL